MQSLIKLFSNLQTNHKIILFQTLKHNDDTEKLPVVYLDETYIHSGHTAGKCWQNDDEGIGYLMIS